ncbi:hypothetical protein ABTZ57_26815 [Streptomyces sp. NPDC094048]|uniref:hypothetical protein n=1 Tax=Streptomyces sp. NPDC094048 TaxID=3155207 RepID=UPI00332E2489
MKSATAAGRPSRPAAPAAAPGPEPVDGDQESVLQDLTREQVLDWRNRAADDHRVLHDHIERYGKHSADSSRTAELARDRWFD